MNIDTVRTILLWCTIINGALILLSFLLVASLGDWIYRMHTKWFPIPRDVFNMAIYCFLGFYKIIFLLFNLVPYIALVIVD